MLAGLFPGFNGADKGKWIDGIQTRVEPFIKSTLFGTFVIMVTGPVATKTLRMIGAVDRDRFILVEEQHLVFLVLAGYCNEGR